MKIIVLAVNPYKEKDAIITAISQKEAATFLVRSINGPRTKNGALKNVLTIADIELMEGNFKHPILKSSKPLFTPLKVDMDEKYLGAIMLIDEMMLNLIPEEERFKAYDDLKDALKALKKNSENWLTILMIFMSRLIKLGGFSLEVNKCVMCGTRKNIVTFSFSDGGFICQDCYNPEIPRDLNKSQMLFLRKIVRDEDYSLTKEETSDEDLMGIFNQLVKFVEESFAYHFKNLSLLIDSK